MKLRKQPFIILSVCSFVFSAAYFEWKPIRLMMDWRAVRNTQGAGDVSPAEYETIDHAGRAEPFLTVDILKGKHFWNPQVVIWVEDSVGTYIETLLVTTSTAKGLFFSGRSASNFKQADEDKATSTEPTRRVDALPYWSHKRGNLYPDGHYSPPPEDPLPDGITSATPNGNFYFKSRTGSADQLNSFRVMIEINVAFDENEFYSEYDYLEDSIYHGGTGLLGQPSLVYMASVNRVDKNHYYVANLIGHGHHSGSTGQLFDNLETVTTAKYVAERIVIGVVDEYFLTPR